MLHKSFKPAKCKTSLRLATSRIKLMKNKKGVQINQIKKDLAKLLESGQDRTARIRVEHVIREEKMVAAYDLIEIYCELIVARLPIIESQKTCPIDLKEAITSVIFAAPRCSDITELQDIRKHFTAKYGKEFVSAALELRPDCGVSRMLVEKLSAVAPDLQTKVKVLGDVAKEHNIKWDPTSFEEKESKPPSDLLNGPANFEEATMTIAPPKIQASKIHDVHSHEKKQDAPVDFSQQNRRYTVGPQNITSTDTGDLETSSAAGHADIKSSGTTSERMEVRQSLPRYGNDSSSGRQNWNMEFKDAASAAEAAAESAERASMAARAAAHLSNQGKITRQYSTESRESNIKERPQVSATSEIPGQHHSRDSYNSSFDDRKSKILNQQTKRSEHDISPKATERFYGDNHGGNKRTSRPASFKSRNGSFEDGKVVNNFHREDDYFRESSHEDEEVPSSPEMSTKKEFKEPNPKSGSDHKESFKSENFNYFAEEIFKNQPSISSSRSHSNTISDELEDQKFGKKTVVGNPFAVVNQGNHARKTTRTSSYVDAPRDDEPDSDDDDGPRFDMGFENDEGEAKSFFPSPGRESPIHPLGNAHSSSPRRNKNDTADQVSSQSHFFSEKHSFHEHSVNYVDSSETDNHIPVSFDHSDGPDSESESELAMSSFSGLKAPEPAHVESSQKVNSRKSRIELNDLVERESSFYNHEDEEKSLQSQQPSRLLRRHESKNNNRDPQSYDTLKDNNDFLNQSDDLDTGKEFNFGTLTGGLRNKGGLGFPPYTKSAATDASSSKKSVGESPVTGDQTSPQGSFNSRTSRTENKKPSVLSSSDSDSDDYSDKFPVVSSRKASKQAKTRSQFLPPVSFFNDNGTDSEEEAPKQASTGQVRLGPGLSRRTKGSASAPYSKSHVEPEPEAETVISISPDERKPSRQSYAGRFKKEDHKQVPESPTLKREESLKSRPVEQPFSPSRKTAEIRRTETQRKPRERFYSNETPTMPEPRISTREESIKSRPVEPPRKTAEPVKTETPKPSVLGSETKSEENAAKKPSHVHPKLPDYDSLAARIQFLRTNRQ